MTILKTLAWIIIAVYFVVGVLLFVLQTRLIFYPGRLTKDYKFRLGDGDREVFLKTKDEETINAIFFRGDSKIAILYFHGNAGDLSGWQYVAEDFVASGFNVLVLDYRGYGKSTGRITEKGLYIDAATAYDFLIKEGFAHDEILIYGRSIGSGVAVDLAVARASKGLILESPFSSLGKLANEKFPLFFPSIYLKFKFDNLAKINKVECPVVFLHGSHDTLIPSSHSQELFNAFNGRKEMIIVDRGSHNDLHSFARYGEFLRTELRTFFGE